LQDMIEPRSSVPKPSQTGINQPEKARKQSINLRSPRLASKSTMSNSNGRFRLPSDKQMPARPEISPTRSALISFARKGKGFTSARPITSGHLYPKVEGKDNHPGSRVKLIHAVQAENFPAVNKG
jgi:hypothetical protein